MKKFFLLGALGLGILIGAQSTRILAFSDEGQIAYPEATKSMFEKGLMSGYPDGSFQPKGKLSRAEALAVLVKMFASEDLANFPVDKSCFEDTPAGDWTAPLFCLGADREWVSASGLARPAAELSLAEGAQMVKQAFGWEFEPMDPWYRGPLEALASRKAIPKSLSFVGEVLRREEWAEILWRLGEAKLELESRSFEELNEGSCKDLNDEAIVGVDLAKVRDSWLSWTNAARAQNGLSAYVYNPQLHRSANVWSQEAKARGNITHKRNSGDAYYDYNKVGDWFKNLGLTFKNVSGSTYTENIGWGPYSCSTGDCTEKLTNAVRSTFDFFMSEAGSAYRPHYNSIMNSEFTQIGFGVSVDTRAKRYYLTIHYGTEITSDPAPLCEE